MAASRVTSYETLQCRITWRLECWTQNETIVSVNIPGIRISSKHLMDGWLEDLLCAAYQFQQKRSCISVMPNSLPHVFKCSQIPSGSADKRMESIEGTKDKCWHLDNFLGHLIVIPSLMGHPCITVAGA